MPYSDVIRPAARAFLHRSAEAIAAGVLLAFGLWLVWLGGYLLAPLGLAVAAVAAAWAVMALRRMRFAQGAEAPGLVEVDEGRIGYLGPEIGGFVNLPELIELRLIALRGRRMWRLKQADGQAILIPVDATGAAGLFDAFATLPGIDMGALVAALNPSAAAAAGTQGAVGLPTRAALAEMQLIWRRPGPGVLARGQA